MPPPDTRRLPGAEPPSRRPAGVMFIDALAGGTTVLVGVVALVLAAVLDGGRRGGRSLFDLSDAFEDQAKLIPRGWRRIRHGRQRS